MSQTPNNTQSWSAASPQFPNSGGQPGAGAPSMLPPAGMGGASGGQPRMLPPTQGGIPMSWLQNILSMFQGQNPRMLPPQGTPPMGNPVPAPGVTNPVTNPSNSPGISQFSQGFNPVERTPPNQPFPGQGNRFVPGGQTPGNNWFNPQSGMVRRGNGTEVPISMQGGQPGWVGGQGNWNPLSNIWSGQYPGMVPRPFPTTPNPPGTNPSIPEQPLTR